MKVIVEVVNAFVDGETGGNPAGVVLDAQGLNAAQKLKIAKVVGLSETAFVSPSEVATLKLEFFTPERKIAHCGHATIATFSRLSMLGRVGNGRQSKETIDGTREIIVDGPMVYMEQSGPTYTDVSDTEEVRASIGLADVEPMGPVSIVNTGNSFLVIPLRNADAVAGLRPDRERIRQISERYNLIGYFVFSRETVVPLRHAGARMFAPFFGIDEEAATGMAAGPLACYLRDHQGVDATTLYIEQGRLMNPPSPSVIKVDLRVSNGVVDGLMAGGVGRSVHQMEMEL
jgi:PhzF family phenazine biosynthesis protein